MNHEITILNKFHAQKALFMVPKICNTNFWLERNDPPSPPYALFRQFIPSPTLWSVFHEVCFGVSKKNRLQELCIDYAQLVSLGWDSDFSVKLESTSIRHQLDANSVVSTKILLRLYSDNPNKSLLTKAFAESVTKENNDRTWIQRKKL